MTRTLQPPRRALAAGAVLSLAGASLAAGPAAASSSGLVVAEVYGGGGNSGASYRNDFVELRNTSPTPVSLDGMSVQYRSASGGGTGVTPLAGTVPAGGRWLVAEDAGDNSSAAPLPDPDDTGTLALSASSGIVFVAGTTAAVTPGGAAVVDLVGYGSASAYEGSGPAPRLDNTTSDSRSATGADTDDNAADLTAGAPSPEGSGGTPPPPEPTQASIEEIQGTGPASPLAGQDVVTTGVVTAAYPTGGLAGFTIQTSGTGGDVDPAAHAASDGLFVYLGVAAPSTYPAVGDHVEVTGRVSEYDGLTELTPPAGGITALAPVAAPRPADVAWPGTDPGRESLESMLVAPAGPYTVTDNYALNQYGEVGLARGTRPLPQPTDVALPGAAADAVAAANAERAVVLDDGANTDFLSGPGRDVPLPYLTRTHSVRVGAPAVFDEPVVVDHRHGAWTLQPTHPVTGPTSDAPARFPDSRTTRPENVDGDLQIASFNVLNYFTETGEEWVAAGHTCTFYDDRAGDPVTDRECSDDGPRGAAEEEDLLRQQAKIVAAINGLGADVLSLEEIENSAKYGHDRDAALAHLVDALNAAGGPEWAYVPSPAEQPALETQDVIRTAFIYRPDVARPVGASHILVGSAAFDDAREPLGQVFRPVGGNPSQDFLVVVNHFKSKGSGVDDGTGQGLSNPDRVAQAKALVGFADRLRRETSTRRVFLVGDFNSYTREDPMRVLYRAGYTDVGSTRTDESTYLFDGVVGSLDHVLAGKHALRSVTGADVWNINSVEPVAYEYSRYNYNVTDLFSPTPYRASDHDPLLVGIHR